MCHSSAQSLCTESSSSGRRYAAKSPAGGCFYERCSAAERADYGSDCYTECLFDVLLGNETAAPAMTKQQVSPSVSHSVSLPPPPRLSDPACVASLSADGTVGGGLCAGHRLPNHLAACSALLSSSGEARLCPFSLEDMPSV